MNRRLAKEFRSLVVPTLLAIAGAFLMALACDVDLSTSQFEIGLYTFILLLKTAPFLFYISLAFAAGLSYGFEFQYRTLAVLLSQPIPRLRIWREKLVILAM